MTTDIDNGPIKLVTTRSDAELAEEFKVRMRQAYAPVCQLMDEMNAAEFMVQVQIGPNVFGKCDILQFVIVKKF